MAALIVDWVGATATPPYKALVLIPQDYDHLTLMSGSAPNGSWELDTMAFWNDLKALEASEAGIVFHDVQSHNSQYTIAGTTYADAVALLCEVAFYNPVPSEDWTVTLSGSNNDIFDVEGGIFVPAKGTGHLTLVPSNSAGLVVTDTSGLTIAESAALLSIATDVATSLALQTGIDARDMGKHITNPTLGKAQIVNDTAMRRWEADAWEDLAETIPYKGEGLEVVGELTEIAY